MTDRIFLHLSDGWAVAHDRLQWILQKREGSRWRGVSFVGGKKATLIRILGERHIEVAPEAGVALRGMPDTFMEWRAQRNEQQREMKGAA